MAWIIVLYLIAAFGFSSGITGGALIFAGIASFLLYRRLKPKPVGPSEKKLQSLYRRFDNNSMVVSIVRVLRGNNYADYRSGIKVYQDHLEFGNHQYRYVDHGLSDITISDCKDLATYFGDLLPVGSFYKVDSLTTFSVSNSPVYYYETPGGHLASGGGGDYSESVVGYEVRSVPAPQKDTKPVTRKW